MTTDSEVIQRSRDYPRAFGDLFHRHHVAVYRYIARRAGAEAADEVMAEPFLVAFERRDRFDHTYIDALPWLFGIATTLLAAHRRREARHLNGAASKRAARSDGMRAEATPSLSRTGEYCPHRLDEAGRPSDGVGSGAFGENERAVLRVGLQPQQAAQVADLSLHVGTGRGQQSSCLVVGLALGGLAEAMLADRIGGSDAGQNHVGDRDVRPLRMEREGLGRGLQELDRVTRKELHVLVRVRDFAFMPPSAGSERLRRPAAAR